MREDCIEIRDSGGYFWSVVVVVAQADCVVWEPVTIQGIL
jgi:hypothetical protein